MNRGRRWLGLVLAGAFSCSACESLDRAGAIEITADNTWAFTPPTDRFSSEALLDLRHLNESVAGETGFVKRSANGQDFVRGDGTPIRFWAVNSYIHMDGERDSAFHARFLAKRGVNMVRWHGAIGPRREGAKLEDIDTRARDRLWQLVAAMKREGIYLTISPYYAQPFRPQAGWETPRDSERFNGLLFFDPVLQDAYKTWLRELLTVENPHTGVALKDDPAVAIIQLQNEDSLLFWTFENVQGSDRDLLARQYGNWLQQKYGSLADALEAWENQRLEGDQLDRGQIDFYPTWELTQPPPRERGKARRLADQTEFLTETMRRFNENMKQYLREELGVEQLINAGNWKTADPARLNDAERYSYTTGDVIAVNRYYAGGVHRGKNSGWAIMNGDRFTDRSVLLAPQEFPLNLKQVAGYPMLVTESSWVPPLSYQSEGPFLTSIYQSLTGIDGFYWFAVSQEGWRQPSSANGYLPSLGKWVVDTPELLGNFPAAALLYRKGYVQSGQPVVRERRSLQTLWQRSLPLLSEAASFDPNRDREAPAGRTETEGRVNSLAFLVGPVTTSYGNAASESETVEFTPFIDRSAEIVRSTTGEIVWDYGRGICTLNAPKAQGASGFLGASGTISLDRVTIEARNHYVTAVVVALDDRELGQSQRALLQVGTQARPTGWVDVAASWETDSGDRESGQEILDYGRAPWRIVNNDLTVEIENPNFSEVVALDANGMPQGTIQLQKKGDRVRFVLPAEGKYFILK